MAGRRLAFSPPSTPLHGRDQPLSSSPLTDEKKLLNALSGLSRQLTLLASNVNEQFGVVNSRLLSMEDRLAALESKNCNGTVEENNSKKRRRVHNPKIAVRISLCKHIFFEVAQAKSNVSRTNVCFIT